MMNTQAALQRVPVFVWIKYRTRFDMNSLSSQRTLAITQPTLTAVFGNSFTTNQKVEGVIISLKYIFMHKNNISSSIR